MIRAAGNCHASWIAPSRFCFGDITHSYCKNSEKGKFFLRRHALHSNVHPKHNGLPSQLRLASSTSAAKHQNKHRNRQASKELRESRKQSSLPVTPHRKNWDVDYRYRETASKDEMHMATPSLRELWGTNETEEEDNRHEREKMGKEEHSYPSSLSSKNLDSSQGGELSSRRITTLLTSQNCSNGDSTTEKQPMDKFIPFFDEIDAIIQERGLNKWERSGMIVDKQGGNVPKPEKSEVPDTIHSAISSSSAKNVDVGAQSRKDTKTASSFFEESLFYDRINDESSLPQKSILEELSTSKSSFLSSSSSHNDSNKRPRSIFDAFPLPPPSPLPTEHNPNAFNTEAFEQYVAIMNDVVETNKFTVKSKLSKEVLQPVIDWLKRPEKLLQYEYPVLYEAMQSRVLNNNVGPLSSLEGDSESSSLSPSAISSSALFCAQLHSQRERFLEETSFTPEQYDAAVRALSVIGIFCAKRARALPLLIGWEKIKESGMILDENAMNTYLYVVSTASAGLGIGGFGLGLPRDIIGGGGSGRRHGNEISASMSSSGGGMSILDFMNPDRKSPGYDETEEVGDSESSMVGNRKDMEDEDKESMGMQTIDIPEEVATFHDLLYKPTEKSVAVRVKALVSKGDASGAEKLLDSFKSDKDDLKLRSYLPILRLYCEQGNVSSALKLFKRMRDNPSIAIEPENYVQVIATVAENGSFRVDSDPIEDVEDLGYSPAYGPELFDILASQMAEDVLEITSASARRLYNAFTTAFKGTEMGKNLKETHSLAPINISNERASDGELVVSRVSIDGNTAVCPRTGAKLRLIMLNRDQRKRLHNVLLELSKSQFEKFGGRFGSATKDHLDYAAKELANFAEWLETREGEPFTAIVDGANVAYYMQNFDEGKFNYHQIQFMVDALEKMKETPLVIIPKKYSYRTFAVRTGGTITKQYLKPDERAIQNKLFKSGKLYIVPARCLDDYYWMLATVSDQTKSREGADLDVSPNNKDGRWPGTRPMLVTNDQMNDHKLELMEPRLFRRWYSCHIVNYSFTAFVDDECVDREISFSTADFFSREIQGNPTPAEGTDSGGGISWHFPVSDWDLDDRFCIRIPRWVELTAN